MLLMYAAMSYACSSLSTGRSHGVPSGMLPRMNDADVRMRCMLAPSLKLPSPHSGGTANSAADTADIAR